MSPIVWREAPWSQHGGRGRVSKHPGVHSGRANAGQLDRACRGLPHDLPRDGDPRGQNRAEHAGRVERWTGVFAGVQEGIADLLRKREPSLAATFPGDQSVPSCQWRSAKRGPTTSLPRSPRRAITRIIARSRAPRGVDGSHAGMIRSTSSVGRYWGKVAQRHRAMVGIASSKLGAQWPLAIRKRTNMRVTVTPLLALPSCHPGS